MRHYKNPAIKAKCNINARSPPGLQQRYIERRYILIMMDNKDTVCHDDVSLALGLLRQQGPSIMRPHWDVHAQKSKSMLPRQPQSKHKTELTGDQEKGRKAKCQSLHIKATRCDNIENMRQQQITESTRPIQCAGKEQELLIGVFPA